MMAEREINLIDLMLEILSHWRSILICMLVGALLMGGISYVRSYQRTGEMQLPDEDMTPEEQLDVLKDLLSNKDMTPEEQLKELKDLLSDMTSEEQLEVLEILLSNKDMTPEERLGVVEILLSNKDMTPEEQLGVLENLLTDSEKMAVYTVIDDEQEIIVNQQYVENSVVMQMNPYSIPMVDMLFEVQIDDMGQSYMLRSVYEDLINGVGLLQWVEEQTGISSISADELISAQAKSNITVLNGVQETESGSDCLKVTVIHCDEAECKKLAQCVKDYIEQQYDQLAQELGAHEVVLLSESIGIVMDTEIRDRQLMYSNNRITFLTNCAKAKDAFSEGQQLYYDLLNGNERVSEEIDEFGKDELGADEPEVETEPVIAKPSISIKYVALGAVLFAFIYVFYIFLKFILNGKLQVTDDVNAMYGVPELGMIPEDQNVKNKKVFAFVDQWILKLRDWNKRKFAPEKAIGLAAAAVKIAAKKEGMEEICCIGCDMQAPALKVADAIQTALKEENISMRVINNVLYDQEAMEQLLSAKGAFLLEKAEGTLYNEIESELEILRRQDIKVLGIVVME